MNEAKVEVEKKLTQTKGKAMKMPMQLWDVEVRRCEAFSNEPRKDWNDVDETLTVAAKTFAQAAEKARRHTLKDFKGQFKSDDTDEVVKYWATNVRIMGIKDAGTVVI